MRRGSFGRSGASGRGGLYGAFVTSSDSNRPYRGAEIAPPTHLNSGRGGGMVNEAPRDRQSFNNPTPGVSKHGYSSLTSIHASNMSFQEAPIRKQRTEEEYFNDDEEAEAAQAEADLPYQPAPGSPGATQAEESDSEEDPLDAFMANLEKDVQKRGLNKVEASVTSSSKATKKAQGEIKGVRADIDEADDEESYYKWLEDNPNAGRNADEDENDIEYDEEGNPINLTSSKYIDPLPPINHNDIQYDAFEKNFYNEHNDIATLSNIQVMDLQQKLGVKISGAIPPKPVTSFAHFGFDEPLMKTIRKSEFTQPTPIQAQGIPALLSGRDVIGIAKTGSGKTAAFLWPMLVHIMDQPPLVRGDGPIGLILVPTRELALQIYTEAKKFGKVYDLNVVCAYGGGSKWEQSKGFEKGAELVIATPGRMIDMLKMKVTNLARVSYLILDEADRMFDMGFEPQVRSICDHVRPDRQCGLFSATFKRRIERLARDSLNDPIKIVQGSVGEASEDVTQVVKVVDLGGYKWNWLLSSLVEFMSAGTVLIFVTKKQNCEELAHNLHIKEIECRCIHGDLHQQERNEIIQKFKKKEFPILVATDVAARGLDIPHIRTVVNFDVARDIDTHTHRVGRTGRAGVKGNAYTLVTEKDKEFAGHLVRNLEAANQDVPKDLMELAMKSSWFRSSRFKRGRGKGCLVERPGLGMASAEKPSLTHEQYTYGDSSAPKDLGGSLATGAGRLSAVKVAFKNQYMSKFRKAGPTESDIGPAGVQPSIQEQLMPPPFGINPPKASSPDLDGQPMPESGERRKRKSRWE
eukprot:snap_masked-scaffold907_size82601-processed-gene-0.19 protein:Tk01571 transcript:snap_masked-scaffold907_size82601-processed-gene-0.19-mRNA-1 annotation:"atp-dependent rna helicase ddx42-like"